MARKQRPVKIKRYKNSMNSGNNIGYKLKKVIPVVIGLLLIVLLGFLLGKPLLNFMENVNNGTSSSDISSSDSIVVQDSSNNDSSIPVDSASQDVSSQPDESSDIEVIIPPVADEGRVYYYAPVAKLSTEAGVDGVISHMKANGATHLVFDLKNQDGYVHYESANQYASQLKADVLIDVSMLVSKLSANGITPVARIYTFMDKMISTVERSTAVMYQGTETRWLDSSAALGGKAWANPASPIMQQYIIDLTEEIMSLGVKEFVFAGFHTPTGYSLDKRDFGASMDQVLANMKNLIGTLKAKISAKNGYSSWQVDYSAVMPEGNYDQYIVHPYQLGAENIILTAKGNDVDVAQVVSSLESTTQDEFVNSVTLWLTDGINGEMTQTMDDYFIA